MPAASVLLTSTIEDSLRVVRLAVEAKAHYRLAVSGVMKWWVASRGLWDGLGVETDHLGHPNDVRGSAIDRAPGLAGPADDHHQCYASHGLDVPWALRSVARGPPSMTTTQPWGDTC